MKEGKSSSNLRETWEQSPALRAAVRDEVRDWASAMRDGGNFHGFPSIQPWAIPTPAPVPFFDPRAVDAIDESLTLWRLIAEKMGGDCLARTKQLHRILRRHYLERRSMKENAKEEGVSRATFARRVDECLFTLWVFHLRGGPPLLSAEKTNTSPR